MKYLLSLLIIAVSLPLAVNAQQNDDDPFKRDPIFSKPLDELLGVTRSDVEEEPREEPGTERVIRHLSRTGIDLGGSLEAGPYYSNSLYNQYPNLPMIHFNRVNGLFLGIRKERMQWHRRGNFLNIPQIEPHGYIGWGTASREWEYAIGLEKLFGERKRLMAGAEIHRGTVTEDIHRAGLVESSITSFFASYDYFDYYRSDGFGLYTAYRTSKWVEAAFSYNRSRISSLQQNTSYSMFGYSSVYRPNPPVDALADEIDLDRFSMVLSLNPRNVLIGNRFTMSGEIGAELADNGATDTDYRYDKYWSGLSLFYNFEPGSVLRWNLRAGGITGTAPDIMQFYLGGIGTLRGSPYKFYGGNQMINSNLEIQFGRPTSRREEWIADYNVHLLVFLDSGWADFIPEMTTGSSPVSGFSEFRFSDMQHDIGAGIGTGAFRFELAWPLNNFDRSAHLWLRFNPTF